MAQPANGIAAAKAVVPAKNHLAATYDICDLDFWSEATAINGRTDIISDPARIGCARLATLPIIQRLIQWIFGIANSTVNFDSGQTVLLWTAAPNTFAVIKCNESDRPLAALLGVISL